MAAYRKSTLTMIIRLSDDRNENSENSLFFEKVDS